MAASSVRPIDDRRLLVAPPAHSPGLVDVGLVQHGERATLAGAYTYDPVVVAPREGPSEGGTPVTVRTAGPSLAAGDEVRFGGSPCTDLVVEAPDRATCLTPPGPVGNVDVEVVHASGALERAVRGFTYRLVAP
ncbi:MAG: IPT/TIG domain-containing protein [Sandaracinaceae bacterium]